MSRAELQNCKASLQNCSVLCESCYSRGGNRRRDRDATIDRRKEEFKASTRSARGEGEGEGNSRFLTATEYTPVGAYGYNNF